ncbi:hypothetical protein MMC15_006746 [Xylographa vitiligo]|nr:hypothetical protein [Xylographa vitiligo]
MSRALAALTRSVGRSPPRACGPMASSLPASGCVMGRQECLRLFDPPGWHGRNGERPCPRSFDQTRVTKDGTERGAAKRRSTDPRRMQFPMRAEAQSDGQTGALRELKSACLHPNPTASGPRADRPPLRHHPDEWEREASATLLIPVPGDRGRGGGKGGNGDQKKAVLVLHCDGWVSWRGLITTGECRLPETFLVGRRVAMSIPGSQDKFSDVWFHCDQITACPQASYTDYDREIIGGITHEEVAGARSLLGFNVG